MGHLDQKTFASTISRCTACTGSTFDVRSYLDRQHLVMLAEPNDDGRWTHDGEKFIDGCFRVTCTACTHLAFASEDCPRCHRSNALHDALDMPTRLAVPKRCPECKGTEVTVLAFVPAAVRVTAGARPPEPTPSVGWGDPGFHVAAILCDACDWVTATPDDACPLCGGPGPLRPRP